MTAERLVPDASIKQWHRDGFLHLTDFLDPALSDALSDWSDDVAGSDDERVLQHHEMTDDGPVLARSEHFATLHPGFGSLVGDGVIARLGGELIGEPIVLYKEKINHKLPGGAGFAPHQDATAYRFVGTHLTCMIAIDDSTIENGCLEVAAGCHHELLVDDGDGCLPPSAERALNWRPLEMRAGDVLWFHSRTPHRSGSNTSSRSRRAVFLTFNAAAEGDLRSAYYADKIDRLQRHVGAQRARVSTIGHFLGRSADDATDHENTSNNTGATTMTDDLTTASLTRNRVPWMELRSAADVASAITDLYERKGASNYDEAVTQLAHALQCGNLAMESGATSATIVAAFLHDIGHLLVDEHDGNGDFLARDLHHEEVGARFLANWFGPEITEPIRLHVPAKRFLCATDSGYHDGLSAASVRSLEVQGGPMNDDELAAFRASEGFETAVDLRRWDDGAKLSDASTPSLDTFATLIESVASVSTTTH
ncbi:MAG: phosphonate degradation associated HDIG domain protein [Candidatus Aldehydirespiratoraceae bacterium]|jgi:phosphonate degradation associated HDIG domain protein